MKREGDKLIVCDIRQISTYYKGEYEIDPSMGYETKEGVNKMDIAKTNTNV